MQQKEFDTNLTGLLNSHKKIGQFVQFSPIRYYKYQVRARIVV